MLNEVKHLAHGRDVCTVYGVSIVSAAQIFHCTAKGNISFS
jgi:hypothetical protein